MWNRPTPEELERLPRLYETDDTSLEDKVIHQHYFLGSCDWYMAEYGSDERIFFGYAILNDDHQNAEWGYTSLDELISVSARGVEVDRDLHWQPRKFKEIERVRGE